MSRSTSRRSSGRRSSTRQSFRRMNYQVDHSHRNKRRAFGFISAGVVIAAVIAIAVSVSPLIHF